MPRLTLLFVLALVGTAWLRVAATEYSMTTYYSQDKCIGRPHNIFVIEDANCSAAPCTMTIETQRSTQCTSNYIKTMRKAFDYNPFILAEFFDDSSCSTFSFAGGFLFSGLCEASTNSTALGFNYTNAVLISSDYNYAEMHFNTVTVEFFDRGNACGGDSYYAAIIDWATLESHACDGNGHRWYAFDDSPTTSSGIHLSSGEIVAICLGCLLIVLLVLVLRCVFCKRFTDTTQEESLQTNYTRSS